MIYFFKELGLSLDSRDNKGSTPLHWACFKKSESAISFLLAWGADFNAQDNDGSTPLHMAVL